MISSLIALTLIGTLSLPVLMLQCQALSLTQGNCYKTVALLAAQAWVERVKIFSDPLFLSREYHQWLMEINTLPLVKASVQQFSSHRDVQVSWFFHKPQVIKLYYPAAGLT